MHKCMHTQKEIERDRDRSIDMAATVLDDWAEMKIALEIKIWHLICIIYLN